MAFQEYQDPKLGKYLHYGYWYEDHKEVFRKIAIGAAFFALSIVWIGLFYQIYLFVNGTASFNEAVNSLTAYHTDIESLHQERAPIPPIVSTVYVAAGQRSGTADFGVIADNNNADWFIEVSYYMTWSGGSTEPQKGFLLPGQEMLFVTRGVFVDPTPSEANAVVLPIRWERIRDPKQVSRIQDILSLLSISKQSVARLDDSTIASYTVHNGSIYDLIGMRFNVLLERAGHAQAFGTNEIDMLGSGEARDMTVRWLERYAGGGSVRAYPIINLTDSSVMKLPTGDGPQY